MVRMIMELVGNRSLTLNIGNNKWSRLQCFKNGVPQGSALAPLFFPSAPLTCVSIMYAHANDLAIMHADGEWQAVLSNDMLTIGNGLKTWKAKAQYYKNSVSSVPSQQQGS